MIEKKYIELMNKEIDKIITEDEKILLYDYLSKNNSAREYYNELLLTNNYLDQLPDYNPSENLKKQIINSIDFTRYSPAAGRKRWWHLPDNPRIKFAYSFAAGLIAGIIIFAVFSNNFDYFSNFKDVSGTISSRNTNSEVIEEIPLEFSDISGKIGLTKSGKNYLINADFTSVQKFDFLITFPGNIEFQSLSPGSSNELEFSKVGNLIKIKNSGPQKYKLSFSKESIKTLSVIQIQLLLSENIVYEHEFLLR